MFVSGELNVDQTKKAEDEEYDQRKKDREAQKILDQEAKVAAEKLKEEKLREDLNKE